jgi:heat shock protein HslJ
MLGSLSSFPGIHAMSPRRLFPTFAVLAVLGAGCQERKTQDAADTSAGAVRANAAAVNAMATTGFDMPAATAGHLTLTDAELFFRPCGRTGAPQKVDDATKGEAIRMMRAANAPPGGLMTLVRLDGNRLLQVRYASAEKMSCKDLPSPATIDANGNEPFWAVRIEGDLATYRTPYNLQGVVYQGGKWTKMDSARWQFTARRSGEGVTELSLEFVEKRCMDTMALAMYPMSVKLTRGDSILTGCALEGRGSFSGSVDSTRAATATTARRQTASPLWGTAWRLSELNGAPVLENVKATLELARGGKATGNGSCNRFSGTVDVEADSIRFSALLSTRMACAETVMRQESAYLEALANAERYTREGNSMLVYLKGSAKPLRFEPL